MSLRLGALALMVVGPMACSASGEDAAETEGALDDCLTVTEGATVVVASSHADDEHALFFEATSDTATSWGEKDNEALVLEVRHNGAFLAHVVLHQGKDGGSYGVHTGRLRPGDTLAVSVSALSAPRARKAARLCNVKLAPAASLGNMAEGLSHAPIFHWPTQKRFDDLPVLVGWSRARQSYQSVYTNENGGTVRQCGGGAEGIRSEIARWGRASDIEGNYAYGNGTPTWGRCSGTRPVAPGAPRMEGDHPNFYYGDGHNRLFESRGGYGDACGDGGPEKADGDLEGWNRDNPGNAPEKDEGRVVTLRPVPVDMDAVGYAAFGGRREGIVDAYAPYIYRLTSLELQREGKIDNRITFPVDRYLYVDVHAADVGGSGDGTCGFLGVRSGFVLRAETTNSEENGPQMTADFFGGDNAIKRLAIPLSRAYRASDVRGFVFDAYDGDGIYFLELGDAFIVRPQGTNGASIDYVHRGQMPVDVYVDDDNGGCQDGKNADGPVAGFPYPCTGSQYALSLP